MAKSFVAIDDPVHNLIRNLTRHVPLRPVFASDGAPLFRYDVEAVALPEGYYALALFHSRGGMSLELMRQTRWRVGRRERMRLPREVNYFDAVRLDRRCCRDLRLKMRKQGPGMLAGELLAFGAGTLRARNDDPLEQVHRQLWSQHGRIQTRHEVVHATIRALHWHSLPLLHETRKESFDSTNLIYGDAFGELEQLWDRRADTVFLDQVAQSLRQMRGQAETAAYLHPPLNLPAVMKMHLRCQCAWKSPPTTARSLLRRLEYILGNTTADASPRTVFRRFEPEPDCEVEPLGDAGAAWQPDMTGYDGWLTGDN
jgi:hypothetical protein